MSGEHNELEESSDDTQLEDRLRDNCLDPDYWLNEMRELGITDIDVLQGADYSRLENKSRYPLEKRALRNLFNIPESSIQSMGLQERQAQALVERNDKASKIIEELNVLGSEERSPQDEAVSKKVEEIMKLLEIPTAGPPDKTLNFVFSIRNSLEIAAYSELEEKYSEWAWRLRVCTLMAPNEINDLSHKTSALSNSSFFHRPEINYVYWKVREELNRYFNNNKEKNTLVQWRAKTENRLAALKEELTEEKNKKEAELSILKKKNREIDDMKNKYEVEIYTKIEELARSLKGQNLNTDELKVKFTTLWNGWIPAVAAKVSLPDPPKIHRDLEEILAEHFKGKVNITDTIRESYKWKNLTNEFYKFVSDKKKALDISETLPEDEKTKITNSIQVIMKRIDEYINRKEQENMDYQSGYFHEILRIIRGEINTMSEKFRFHSDYIVYASLFLCRKAAHRFEKLSDAYRNAKDPVVYLESKKEDFYKSFILVCKEKSIVASLGDMLFNKLQVSLQEAVYEQSAFDVSNDIRCNYPALNGNRSRLQFYLLKSLAERENFQNYLAYVRDPKSVMREFIRECIEDYMRDTSMVSDILHNNVDKYRKLMLCTIAHLTLGIIRLKGNMDSWLDIFCSGLGNELNLSRHYFKTVKYRNISEIYSLEKTMTQAVDTAVEKLHSELSTCDMADIKGRIFTILTDNFLGC
ncbi:interferon-induced very large GTPase 1-like [Dendropsophus ebraccatus]|uniref:interferon-induced very large GTPase 1-like n=1 Tax=Dendropsophus ebraccatus TaxID=150705 RepID=UPI0038322A92